MAPCHSAPGCSSGCLVQYIVWQALEGVSPEDATLVVGAVRLGRKKGNGIRGTERYREGERDRERAGDGNGIGQEKIVQAAIARLLGNSIEGVWSSFPFVDRFV